MHSAGRHVKKARASPFLTCLYAEPFRIEIPIFQTMNVTATLTDLASTEMQENTWARLRDSRPDA